MARRFTKVLMVVLLALAGGYAVPSPGLAVPQAPSAIVWLHRSDVREHIVAAPAVARAPRRIHTQIPRDLFLPATPLDAALFQRPPPIPALPL